MRAARKVLWPLVALLCLLSVGAPALAEEASGKVYVILWFDTEDYLLPAFRSAPLDGEPGVIRRSLSQGARGDHCPRPHL